MPERKEKREFTDLEKADCKTGKMIGGIALKQPAWGRGKRRRFVFSDRACCHHVMSRVAGGDLLFGDVEKEAFRKLMRRLERFSGVEVLTYAVMGNHFHLLVRVPEREKFLNKFTKGTKQEKENRLMEHLRLLYSKAYLAQLEGELREMKKKGLKDLYEKTVQGYLSRMCSLEHFMKELKERFSRWFNKRHGRRGTLWQDRYRSVLVENGEALRTMAAYIELNPVRAGLVDDPKDYRWCGLAEALAGSKRAKRGLSMILGIAVVKWDTEGLRAYRCLMLGEGMEAGKKEKEAEKKQERKYRRRGMEREKALAELRNGKILSQAEMLRCRVRYFSDGLVIGTRDFVEEAFQAKREWFGDKRKTGARGISARPEREECR